MVDESQCVLVLMSCEEGYEQNMTFLTKRCDCRSNGSTYSILSQSKDISEFVIDPEELNYPIEKPTTQRTVYNVADIVASVRENNDFVICEHHH